MEQFTKKLRGVSLRGQKFAVFGLGDSTYTHFASSVDHLLEFITSDDGALVGLPLRIDAFFLRQQENESIIRKWAKSLAA